MMPYSSVVAYQRLLPAYSFNGVPAVEVAASAIADMVAGKPGPLVLADCGAGPGYVWSFLPSSICRIIAVEPNRSMWRREPPSHVTYEAKEGLSFLRETTLKIDCASWLWSINYALLSFFETYDPVKREVIQRDWEQGDREARNALRAALYTRSFDSLVFMMFDSESEEQQFITDIWSPVAPFPFHDRGHTRRILIEELRAFCDATSSKLIVEHLIGSADYGRVDEAQERMLQFHLRGHFDSDQVVQRNVSRFLSEHSAGEHVICSAGAYLITVQGC